MLVLIIPSYFYKRLKSVKEKLTQPVEENTNAAKSVHIQVHQIDDDASGETGPNETTTIFMTDVILLTTHLKIYVCNHYSVSCTLGWPGRRLE